MRIENIFIFQTLVSQNTFLSVKNRNLERYTRSYFIGVLEINLFKEKRPKNPLLAISRIMGFLIIECKQWTFKNLEYWLNITSQIPNKCKVYLFSCFDHQHWTTDQICLFLVFYIIDWNIFTRSFFSVLSNCSIVTKIVRIRIPYLALPRALIILLLFELHLYLHLEHCFVISDL